MPDGWVWCSVGGLSSIIQFGLSNSAETSGNYHLLRITDIQNNAVEWNSVPFTNIDSKQAEPYLLEKDDILFARTGATVGKSYLIAEMPVESVFASYLIRVKVFKVDSRYIKFFFESLQYWEQITDKSVGIGQPNVNGTKLKEIILPLPPLAEQHHIVAAIESSFAVIDEIERNKLDLQTAVTIAKQKILSLAIRGKLVPQDPNDEPAAVLLERIRMEREQLIKEGKIKRNKSESAITRGDDNSYYDDLPNSWTIASLSEICSVLTDGTHQTPTYSEKGYIFLSSKNVTSGKIDWENVMYIPQELHNTLYSRIAPELGDILLAKNGTTGFAAIVDRECVFDIYVSLALIRTFKQEISPEYLRHIISSEKIQEHFKGHLKGIGVPNLHLEHIRSAVIPLPPLAEQHRIVTAIETAFEQLDNIGSMIV